MAWRASPCFHDSCTKSKLAADVDANLKQCHISRIPSFFPFFHDGLKNAVNEQ